MKSKNAKEKYIKKMIFACLRNTVCYSKTKKAFSILIPESFALQFLNHLYLGLLEVFLHFDRFNDDLSSGIVF